MVIYGKSRSTSPTSRRWPGRRFTCLYLPLAILLLLALFVYTPLPNNIDNQRDSLVDHVANATKSRLPSIHLPQSNHQSPSLESTKSKYAFATFLGNDAGHNSNGPYEKEDMDLDRYFVATRLLAYQLLHAPETRSQNTTITSEPIPLIVLVTDAVSEEKRQRLRSDGAIIQQAEPLQSDWMHTDISTWQDVTAKMHLWSLDQFSLICFLDADTVLTGPLDGIFADPAVTTQTTLTNPSALRSDEAPLPPTFVFAGTPEMHHKHHYPPSADPKAHDYPNPAYLNAGFFVLAPSPQLLTYYTRLVQLPEQRFDPKFPEQNLLNYAHRRDGNMPWQQLDVGWNVHYPSTEDLDGGVRSLHEKWWVREDKSGGEGVGAFLRSWRWRMEGFWQGREGR
ncbi:hypothetical protein MBLNU230_g5291t1 [Neophaeotheca triangularis]